MRPIKLLLVSLKIPSILYVLLCICFGELRGWSHVLLNSWPLEGKAASERMAPFPARSVRNASAGLLVRLPHHDDDTWSSSSWLLSGSTHKKLIVYCVTTTGTTPPRSSHAALFRGEQNWSPFLPSPTRTTFSRTTAGLASTPFPAMPPTSLERLERPTHLVCSRYFKIRT